MRDDITARRIVLDATRFSGSKGVEAWRFVKIGKLFGVGESAIRVAVTRLCAGGQLVNIEPGTYRVGRDVKTRAMHLEGWRRGEARVRPWKGNFLAVLLPSRGDRTRRRASQSALDRLGFREGMSLLYVRPDNLRMSRAKTEEQLSDFGLQTEAEMVLISGISERLLNRDLSRLWPVSELERGYQRTIEELTESLEHVPNMSQEEALVQVYVVGRRAVSLLSSDPLLPEEIMPTERRGELSELTLHYETVAYEHWHRFMREPALSLVDGGRRAG